MGNVLVGISSWTERTLIKEGNFYPPGAKTATARLQFYTSQFPMGVVFSGLVPAARGELVAGSGTLDDASHEPAPTEG